MRQLSIVGVDASTGTVDCEVDGTGERLTLPLDDRLRAAARGEYVGPESEPPRPAVTGTLRPREIQDRIRHGTSAEQVAAEAGVPLSRIEGFAHPVLLERATAADRARRSHPVLSDGPALDTLADRVEAAVGARGIEAEQVHWDAWRIKGGGWMVRTSWPAGLSEDAAATWEWTPDSHGGSARPLDEEAEALLDPERFTRLRAVAAPTVAAPPVRSVPPAPPVELDPPVQAERDVHALDAPPPRSDEVPAALRNPTPAAVAPPFMVAEPRRPDVGRSRERPTDDPTAEEDDFLRHPPSEADEQSRRTKARHPAMPSWEDVLLGVRSKDD